MVTKQPALNADVPGTVAFLDGVTRSQVTRHIATSSTLAWRSSPAMLLAQARRPSIALVDFFLATLAGCRSEVVLPCIRPTFVH